LSVPFFFQFLLLALAKRGKARLQVLLQKWVLTVFASKAFPQCSHTFGSFNLLTPIYRFFVSIKYLQEIIRLY
jgi:hypothetical protein